MWGWLGGGASPGSADIDTADRSHHHCPGWGRHLLTAAVVGGPTVAKCGSDVDLPSGLCYSVPFLELCVEKSQAHAYGALEIINIISSNRNHNIVVQVGEW